MYVRVCVYHVTVQGRGAAPKRPGARTRAVEVLLDADVGRACKHVVLLRVVLLRV